MSDCFTVQERSRVMSLIRSFGSVAEREVHTLLVDRFGEEDVVYQPKDLEGKPDFLVLSRNLVLFVDGCFFHACPKHYIPPVQNAEYWLPKIARNKKRDREVNRSLKAKGYSVLRIWEHDARDKNSGRRSILRRLRRIASQPTGQ